MSSLTRYTKLPLQTDAKRLRQPSSPGAANQDTDEESDDYVIPSLDFLRAQNIQHVNATEEEFSRTQAANALMTEANRKLSASSRPDAESPETKAVHDRSRVIFRFAIKHVDLVKFLASNNYDPLPFEAVFDDEVFFKMIDEGFLDSNKTVYTSQDRDKLEILRTQRKPGIELTRHPLLWTPRTVPKIARGRPMQVQVKDDEGNLIFQDNMEKFGLSAQLRADIKFYTWLVPIINAYMTLDLMVDSVDELIETEQGVEAANEKLDAISSAITGFMNTNAANELIWKAGTLLRTEFDKAAQPTSSVGIQASDERMVRLLKSLQASNKLEWYAVGEKLKHYRFRDIGIYNWEKQDAYTRERVIDGRLIQCLNKNRDAAEMMVAIWQRMDLVGFVSDWDKAHGIFDAESWRSGFEFDARKPDMDTVWMLDAVLQSMCGDEVIEVPTGSEDPEMIISNVGKYSQLKTRVKQMWMRFAQDVREYDSGQLDAELANIKTATRLIELSKFERKNGDPWEAEQLYDRAVELMPWLKREREEAEALAEKKELQRLLALVRIIPAEIYDDALHYDLNPQLSDDGSVDPEEASKIVDEATRRVAGIPRVYWDQGIYEMNAGDPRRLEEGGRVKPFPTIQRMTQSLSEFVAEKREWYTTQQKIRDRETMRNREVMKSILDWVEKAAEEDAVGERRTRRSQPKQLLRVIAMPDGTYREVENDDQARAAYKLGDEMRREMDKELRAQRRKAAEAAEAARQQTTLPPPPQKVPEYDEEEEVRLFGPRR